MSNEIYFNTLNNNKIVLNSDTKRLGFVNETLPSTLFITTWKTDNTEISNDNQIKIPLTNGGTYSFEVDWGDNSGDTIISDGGQI